MSAVQCRCLAESPNQWNPAQPSLVLVHPRWLEEPARLRGAQVVLRNETVADAAALLRAGARRVYLADAALRQPRACADLAQQFGQDRVGLHVMVQRQAVSWSIETESNADFSVMTPSLCAPTWELLFSDGQPSGVHALPWLAEQRGAGVNTILLRADIDDDADLNLCATAVEQLADALWVAPLSQVPRELFDWVQFGQVRQLVLPTALYAQRHALLKPRAAPLAA
ncbi:MAG: hypothetical protein OHK0048_00710 [Rhodoferax sp.]